MASKPGRKMIKWKAEPVLEVTKMVAAKVYKDGCRSQVRLWEETARLLPAVTRAILNDEWTMDRLVEHVRRTQDREITTNQLLGRAHSAWHYKEINKYYEQVENVLRVAA